MESWSFGYRFKRGDVCNYCGTVFGGDVETYCEGRSKSRLFIALQEAVGVAKKVCERAAGARPCPRCGRLSSEAYASEFNAASS